MANSEKSAATPGDWAKLDITSLEGGDPGRFPCHQAGSSGLAFSTGGSYGGWQAAVHMLSASLVTGVNSSVVDTMPLDRGH